MFVFSLPRLVPVALLLAAFAAQGQSAVRNDGDDAARPAEPTSVTVQPSTLSYRSVFDTYRGWADQPVAAWGDSNRQVGQAAAGEHGIHGASAMPGMAIPSSAPPAAPSSSVAMPGAALPAPPASSAPPSPHAGHGGHR